MFLFLYDVGFLVLNCRLIFYGYNLTIYCKGRWSDTGIKDFLSEDRHFYYLLEYKGIYGKQ